MKRTHQGSRVSGELKLLWSDLQRAEERRNSDRDKNVMVKLLVGYPTKQGTQTCQEMSNLGSVRLGSIKVNYLIDIYQ